VRNASCEVGNARHPAARAGVCSAPTTSLKMKKLVVRRNEWAARSAGQPAFCIAHTVCGPARVGSVWGNARVEWARCRHGLGEPTGGFWTVKVL
jgi:hypothetical protein